MYMPFDILRHVNPRAAGRIAFGGGGGGGGSSTPTSFTSELESLAGQTFGSQEELDAAETAANTAQQEAQQTAANETAQAATDYATGLASDPSASAQQYSTQLNQANIELQQLQNALAADPENASLQTLISTKEQEITGYQQGLDAANTLLQQGQSQAQAQLVSAAMTDPSSIIQQASVGQIDQTGTEIAEGTGQLTGAAPTVTTATAAPAATVEAPVATPASTIEAATVGDQTAAALEDVQAAQGTVSDQAQVTAAEGSDLQSLGLDAAQLAQAQTVQAPAQRVLQEGELIQGSSVDMNKVNEAVQFQAAEAVPSKQATVQGQLEELTADFDASNPPAWAAGALRAATATMAARGLGASSLAGQAVVQATLESALPIAMADAQTRAQFEAQNLSNRQQAALFAAQQRAEFLGMEFTQDFQARVANSARIGEIANINFTAEQQIALENARMAQSVDLANLSNSQAKLMADAAALTQLDLTNLNNRQQAAVANAKAFLDMDLANLSYEQQTSLFKAQSIQQAMFSDQAARNAAAQFNASSENQTNQFFASLANQTSQFNASQTNAVNQFNVGQENAMSQFNANMQNMRDQFNATNSLVIAQANAQWRQSVATTEFAAQHEANMQTAKETNALTMTALEQLWQRERDLMTFAWQSSESAMDRDLSIILADKDLTSVREQIDAQESAARGALVAKVLFGGW